jgi:hypothetical protein
MLAALIIVFDQIDCETFLWDYQSVPGQKRERDRQAYRRQTERRMSERQRRERERELKREREKSFTNRK